MPKGQKPQQPYGTVGDAKFANMKNNKYVKNDDDKSSSSSGRYGPMVDTKKEYGTGKFNKIQADPDNEPSRAGRIDGDAGVSMSGPKPRKGLTSQSRKGSGDYKFFKHSQKDKK